MAISGIARAANRTGFLLVAALLAQAALPSDAASAPARTVHALDFYVHVDLIGPGKDLAFYQNLIDETIAAESNRLLEGFEGPADSPCCTRLRAANVASFGTPGDGLNVIETPGELNNITALPAGAYLVQSVHFCFGDTQKNTARRGCAQNPGNHLMVSMDGESEGLLGALIARGRGQNLGLSAVATEPCSLLGNSGGGCLTGAQCQTYAGAGTPDPNAGTCSCLQDTVGAPPLADGASCTELTGGICSGGLCASSHGPAGLAIYVSAGTDSDASDTTQDRLLRMSAITGGWSVIGTITVGGGAVSVPALAYSPSLDKLFGVAPQAAGNDRLVQIDRSSGAATVIGTMDRRRVVGLTWNPISGRLLGAQIRLFTGDLYETIFVEINPATGAVTQVFGTGDFIVTDGIQGLAFDPNPVDPSNPRLYGSSRVRLFTMNLAACSGGTCAMEPEAQNTNYFAQTALDWVGGIREVKGLAPAVQPRPPALESKHPQIGGAYSALIIDGFTPGGLAVVAPDADGDFAPDPIDTCPGLANPLQTDNDDDDLGNECDVCPDDALNDPDGDAVCGSVDNCPAVANPAQTDNDADGAGNACDSCPDDALNDADADGLCANVDNCPKRANPAIARLAFQTTTGGQLDDDADGWGNTCDADFNQVGGTVDHVDFGLFKTAFGLKRSGSNCPDGGGTDADTLNDEPCDEYDLSGSGGTIDILDFSLFKGLFGKTKKADGDDVEKCAACPLACEGDACGP